MYAIGNYIHYATFMAARAYSSSAMDPETQLENGNRVLQYMVAGKFKGIIVPKAGGINVGPGPYYQGSGAVEEWNQGASYHFGAKLSLYPWSADKQSIVMDLHSESWMPREKTEKECYDRKKQVEGVLNSAGVSNVKVEWDNGC